MYESSIFTNLELFLWLNPQCRLILTLTLLKWTLQITLGGSNLIISIIFFLIYCILVIYFDGCIYRRQNGQLIWVSSHIYPLIDSYSTRLAHFSLLVVSIVNLAWKDLQMGTFVVWKELYHVCGVFQIGIHSHILRSNLIIV